MIIYCFSQGCLAKIREYEPWDCYGEIHESFIRNNSRVDGEQNLGNLLLLPLKCRLRFPYTYFLASLTREEWLKVNSVCMLYSRTQITLAVYLRRLSQRWLLQVINRAIKGNLLLLRSSKYMFHLGHRHFL